MIRKTWTGSEQWRWVPATVVVVACTLTVLGFSGQQPESAPTEDPQPTEPEVIRSPPKITFTIFKPTENTECLHWDPNYLEVQPTKKVRLKNDTKSDMTIKFDRKGLESESNDFGVLEIRIRKGTTGKFRAGPVEVDIEATVTLDSGIEVCTGLRASGPRIIIIP